MSDNKKYPKFIWIIVAIILVTVVGYALLSRQPIKEVKFPGGGVKFGPAPKEESLTFSISYDRDANVIEGNATVFIAGFRVNLAVSRQKPFQTKTVTLPKSGVYAYRLEHSEVKSMISGVDLRTRVAVPYQYRGEGKIDVQPGKAYLIEPALLLREGGGKWSTRLVEIRSEEERRKIEQEAIKQLERELGIK